MVKMLLEVTNTFGKMDGESIVQESIVDDTTQLRRELIEDFSDSFDHSTHQDFIEGRTNSVFLYISGGDWDDPTGRIITLTSYEDKKYEIEEQYKSSLAHLDKLFKKKHL